MIIFIFIFITSTNYYYILSLHDALPISTSIGPPASRSPPIAWPGGVCGRCPVSEPFRHTSSHSLRASRLSRPDRVASLRRDCPRSEEHTSELQSRENLVCRLLLEKKKIY